MYTLPFKFIVLYGDVEEFLPIIKTSVLLLPNLFSQAMLLFKLFNLMSWPISNENKFVT